VHFFSRTHLHIYYYGLYFQHKQTIAGLVKALQAANSTSWHDAFLALWLAALRLVQRVGIYSDNTKNFKLLAVG
jgi:hypothetical protein